MYQDISDVKKQEICKKGASRSQFDKSYAQHFVDILQISTKKTPFPLETSGFLGPSVFMDLKNKTGVRNPLRTPELVGVAGFEPTASWTRTKRDTKLRHTPNLLDYYTGAVEESQALFFEFFRRLNSNISQLYADTAFSVIARDFVPYEKPGQAIA